jgi:type III pantothenate kinase
MEKMLKRITGKKPYIIGKNIKVPMPNLYRGLLGQDRLVNAYAASRLYGAPAIVIDLGTAITIDAVSRDKKYLGGLILPGMELSLEALHRHTALLPKLRLKTPAGLIGRDTAHSILSGIVYGFAGLCDELARKIKNKVGKNAIVIATGGNARLIKKYSREINRSEPLLTFKGLGLIYDKGRALS